MSLPYFPLYPSDFEAKTSHLTLEEDGAYNRLLRLSWMTPGCSLPDDPAWIARRMRIDMATFDRLVAPLLDEFFTRAKGRITNAKLTEIFNESNEKHSRRVEAGKLGGRPPKALKRKQSDKSNAKAMPKQPEPEPEPELEEETPFGSPAEKPHPKARLPDDWSLSDEGWAYARSKQIPDKDIADEARGFHAYWSDRSDKDARKSARGWEQCWEGWVRRIAGRYRSRAGVAVAAFPGGSGRGGGIASIAARRRAQGQF
jgi:uncharacterized protein YdaU (DUF1376 family)